MEMNTTTKVSKFKNVKREVNGITFPSILEAKVYCELLQLEFEGRIENLQIQKKFVLLEGFYASYYDLKKKRFGTFKQREITYLADFSFFKDGQEVVIEAKGFPDMKYPLKKKMFLNKFPEIIFLETNSYKKVVSCIEEATKKQIGD